MSSPKVSILLTSYNHAPYLHEAIDSILNQTYEDFELLLWDDASSDDSWDIIASYSDSRIHSFKNEKRQFIDYFRRAISDVAIGKYIAIHHSDDVWEPDKLEKQVAFLDSNPQVGAVFTWAQIIDEKGNAFENKDHFYYKIFEQPNRTRHEWLNYFFYTGNALCHPSVLIRREVYEEVGLYRYGMAQLPDFDMWVRLALKYEIYVMPEKLVRFRILQNEANSSGDRPKTRIRSQFEYLQLLKNYRKISSYAELKKVFPKAEQYERNGEEDLGFVLGMIAVNAGTHSFTELFGLTLLFEAINNPVRAKKIKELYNFTQLDFIKLSAEHDVFSVEKIRNLYAQLAERDAQLAERDSQLAERDAQLAERDAQLAERDAQLHEIRISKAWRFATHIRKLRVLLVPPNSLRARLARKIYRFFFRNKIIHYFTRIVSVFFSDGVSEVYRLAKNKLSVPLWKIKARLGSTSKREVATLSVSVVIPIYDRTDILIESIESVLRQTYKKFELILVCDGSPKETVEIVKKYEKQNAKVRAFYFKNNSGNAVRGRNKAIKEARGTYLAFHDSDDVAEPDRLAVSVNFIEQYGVDVVYGGWRALLDGTRIDIDVRDKQEVYSPDCDFEMLKEICVPCQSTVMAKVDALREVGGLNEKMRYREDHELWLRLAYKGYHFKSIPKVLTNLRLHQNNLELSLKKDDDFWFNLMLDEYDKERSMKPKIGYVIPGTGIGGGILVVCEHANRMILRGYDVSIITEDNQSEISWFPNLLAPVIPLGKVEQNYDILIATGWATAYTVNLMPSKRKLYLVQSDERRFFEQGDPNIHKAENTYKMNFEFLTVAQWMKDWLKDEFGKDATYIRNGLNYEIVHAVEPLEPKTDKLRILLEGPIDVPFKGMKDAFEAVRGLNCEVWCVSSAGRPKPGWKCDRFFEKVPWIEMKNIYSSCDVLLKMSKVESFSYPPLEMMACGGTAVIGKVTGIEEYAIDRYNALIVQEGDVQGAHNALASLIKDHSLRKMLTENGGETAREFHWDETIDVLEQVFLSKSLA